MCWGPMERDVHGRTGCKAGDRRAELCHWGQDGGWCDRLRGMLGSCQTDSYLVMRLKAALVCHIRSSSGGRLIHDRHRVGNEKVY